MIDNPIRKRRPRINYTQPWIATCSECDQRFTTKTRKIAKDHLYKHKASNCKRKYFN